MSLVYLFIVEHSIAALLVFFIGFYSIRFLDVSLITKSNIVLTTNWLKL